MIENLRFYADHVSFFLNALTNTQGQDSYWVQSSETVIAILEKYIGERFLEDPLPEEERMHLRMFIYANTEVYAYWALDDMAIPLEQMAAIIMLTNLVNTDRDFHQAMIAATQCYDLRSLYKDLPEDELQGYLGQKMAEFDENKVQAVERVEAAIAIAKENADIYTGMVVEGDTMHFADYAEAFEAGYAEWENTYDLADDVGDWNSFNRTFYGYAEEDC